MKLAIFFILFILCCKNINTNTIKNVEVPKQKILTTECSVKRTRKAVSCAQFVDLRYGGITSLDFQVPIILSVETCKEVSETKSYRYLGQIVRVQPEISTSRVFQIKGKLEPSGECIGEEFFVHERNYINHALLEEIDIIIHNEEREFSVERKVLINGRQVEVENEGYQTEESTIIWSNPYTVQKKNNATLH